MPELPEVESLRQSLIPYVVGQSIHKIIVHKPKLVAAKGTVRVASQSKTDEFIQELTNQKFLQIDRVAKNLIFKFESGKIMLVHLKMTGQLVYQSKIPNQRPVFGGHPIDLSKTDLPSKHSHIIFELDLGTLYFNDTRMFGYVLYFQSLQALEREEHFKDLGIDPFDPNFTLNTFQKQILIHKAKLKSIFLSQKVVIGLGNIYADEVCFEAGVRPDRSCNSLKSNEIKALYKAISRIIPLAVALGGSSIANYLLADGSRGNYARNHKVYNRAGKPCFVCGNVLEKSIINSRTTVFCTKCQK